jgi:maltoporin
VPHGFGLDKRTTDASDARLALSANYEIGKLSFLAGGYLRYFRDADGIASDYDDGWEYVFALRPMIFITRNFHQLFEVSYQARRPDGLDPERQVHATPGVFKLAVMPALTWDRGAYSRPQLRLVYALSYLNGAARKLYHQEDPRYDRKLQHYLGVQVEWWINSSYR